LAVDQQQVSRLFFAPTGFFDAVFGDTHSHIITHHEGPLGTRDQRERERLTAGGAVFATKHSTYICLDIHQGLSTT
jgi:hypothetical protein